MSVQFIRSDAKGIIGYIGSMRGSGTQVVLYINHLDKYGQMVGRQKIHVALFNDAERALLKNNARVGDTLMLDGAILCSPPPRKESDTSEGYSAHLKCTWYNQITVIAGNNHQTLMSRNPSITA